MATLGQLLIIVSLLLITIGARLGRSKTFKTIFNNKNSGHTPCTINNTTGICVHESACDEEHRIWEGGVVDSDFNFRSVKQCTFGYWCCYKGTIPGMHTTDRQITDEQTTGIQTTGRQTTDRPTTDGHTTEKPNPWVAVVENKNSNCLAPQTDVCPWCVLLYHTSSVGQNAQHPFCLGALVGSKAIITASTCLTTAKDKTLYAQLPNSSYPGKNYTILQRLYHPNYNTGTHEHDIGLLILETDVTLQNSQGACLDFVRPLEGVCVGYGFDINWKMYSTILQVSDRSCGKAGHSADAACGTNADAVCLVEFGGPIVCPVDIATELENREPVHVTRWRNADYAQPVWHYFFFFWVSIAGIIRNARKGPLVLRGIARGRCNADKVLLGGIARSDRWIENELASMEIPRETYIYKM